MTWTVVIPSARADNLVRCVRSVLATHPGLDPGRVVVVDDGARIGAEGALPGGITWVDGVKPFVFARNVNLGVAASGGLDTVILGDDTEVLTPGGFDHMAAFLRRNPRIAVLSAGIEGLVGNPRQRHSPGAQFVPESEVLAFVCVMIPRSIWNSVGPLDERYTGYGCDDVDYCRRVREAGLGMGVLSGCAVRHLGDTHSTFRERADFHEIWERNKELYRRKWET